MRVLNIGTLEIGIIDEALEAYQEIMEEHLDMLEEEDVLTTQQDIDLIKTTRKLLQEQRLQELCERCLSYFWDMFEDMGCFSDEIEWLMEDMGVDEEEMKEMFKEVGFGEEE